MQYSFEDYAERERQRLLAQRDEIQRKLETKERTHDDSKQFVSVQDHMDRIARFLKHLRSLGKG